MPPQIAALTRPRPNSLKHSFGPDTLRLFVRNRRENHVTPHLHRLGTSNRQDASPKTALHVGSASTIHVAISNVATQGVAVVAQQRDSVDVSVEDKALAASRAANNTNNGWPSLSGLNPVNLKVTVLESCGDVVGNSCLSMTRRRAKVGVRRIDLHQCLGHDIVGRDILGCRVR